MGENALWAEGRDGTGRQSTKVLYSASLLEGASGGAAPAAALSLRCLAVCTGCCNWHWPELLEPDQNGKKAGARAMQRLAVRMEVQRITLTYPLPLLLRPLSQEKIINELQGVGYFLK